jgi:hypothetical protein
MTPFQMFEMCAANVYECMKAYARNLDNEHSLAFQRARMLRDAAWNRYADEQNERAGRVYLSRM